MNPCNVQLSSCYRGTAYELYHGSTREREKKNCSKFTSQQNMINHGWSISPHLEGNYITICTRPRTTIDKLAQPWLEKGIQLLL